MIQCQQIFLVQVVRRYLDDTEAEILYQKVESDGRDLLGRERVALRLEPNVDHRFDRIPKEVVNNDQARQDLISHTW